MKRSSTSLIIAAAAATAAKSLQSRPTLCDPTDGSPPGSAVPGILQARNTGVGCHFLLRCVKVKSLSKCPTLRDPMDYSLPGSSIRRIFQTRVLEWVAIAFSGEIMPHSHLDGYLKKRKTQKITNAGKDVGIWNPFWIVGRNVKLCSCWGRLNGISSKTKIIIKIE